MPEPLISLRNIHLSLGGHKLLEDISLSIDEGRIVTLIGPNGCGKTSLIRVLLGLQLPDQGEVWRRPKLVLGYMPQRMQVDPTLPLTVERFLRLGRPPSDHALGACLAEVRITHLRHAPFQQLSGGEVQRVLLARALLREPQLLVLDEPVQGVDIGGQIELYELIGRLRDRLGCAVFMVSHDLHLVMASSDEVICLNRHLCCSGHPRQVSQDPAFIELFGKRGAQALAPYSHEHDHRHDSQGNILQESSQENDA